MSQPRTRKQWLADRKHAGLAMSGRPYKYIDLPDYVSSTQRIKFKCPDHGVYEVYAFSHLQHGCRDCAKAKLGIAKRGKANWRKFTLEQALAKARKLFPDLDYSHVTEYDPKVYWEVVCPEHGPFKVKVRTHLWDKARGCGACRKNRLLEVGNKLSDDRKWAFDEAVAKFHYSVVKYTRAVEPAILSCSTHGEFTVSAAKNLAQGWSICPACRKASSTGEVLLRDQLEAAGVKVHLHRRDLVKDREIDIYLPEYRLGVEVNGIFWHSDKHPSKGPRYHVDKLDSAKKAGIVLMQFTDAEIVRALDLVTSMVLAKCGLFSNRIGARQTSVQEVGVEVARRFLNANHLQGFHGSAYYYALVVSVAGKKRIAAVASFSRPRFDKQADWELIRFATKTKTQVYGALSKLLAAFSAVHPGSVISYANRRYSTGAGYLASGFDLVRVSKPSYSWHSLTRELTRYQTQKKNLDAVLDDYDPEASETENMENNGYFRLWDCGNLVFIRN